MGTRRRSLALVTGLLLLAGCSAGGGAESGTDTAADSGVVGEGAAGAVEELDESGSEPGEGARLFVVHATAHVAVDDPRRTAAEVATYAERIGGHVQERVESGSVDDGDASAYLVLRVPSDRLTEAIATLEELGDVTSTSTSSTEVTGRSQDLDARIRALEISAERLERLLADARTTADLVSAEQALTERQEQLEQLRSQAARLADQVALATLEVDLWTHDAAPVTEPSGFLGGLETGWQNLVDAVARLLLALGLLLPWLAASAVVGAVVVLVVRARRRARRTPPPAGGAPSPAGATGPDAGPGTGAVAGADASPPAPGAGVPEEGAVPGGQSSASRESDPGSPSSATTSA